MLARFKKNLKKNVYSIAIIPSSLLLKREISSKLNPSQQGLTMLEVLVAIFTITFFLAGTFQLIAIEAFFKVKAETESQASFWVQEDIESIKSIASSIDETSSSVDECDPSDSTNYGYGKTLRDQLTTSSHPNYLVNPVTRKLFTGINKEFTLTRTYNVPTDKPHTLEVSYTVVDEEKKQEQKPQDQYTIVTRYNLVIINAALECTVN
jgi:Tfp pilus assembly protein PilV